MSERSAFELRNVRLFVAFRILFSARFYYPVFTVLFLDYGLTLEQFSWLNVLWAATIVLAEVPSGALADIVGRRRLVIAAATLMVLELATIGFVPLGDANLVFAAFVFNRICSGLAEASASGADEALAYDTLVEAGLEDRWPEVLERLGRLSSIAMFVAMIVGALVYDRELGGKVASALGADALPPKSLVRVPVLMTLATGCLAWLTAVALREPASGPSADVGWRSLPVAFRQVLATGRWILSAPFVLIVIVAGLALDSVARQFVLLGSEYFRLIDIPTYLLGPISAGAALLGIVSARASRLLAERQPPAFNFFLLSGLLTGCLVGASCGIARWGVLFAIGPFLTLGAVGFFQSHYLNAEVDSARRATVLSFKGLALNVGMGLASVLYAGFLRSLPGDTREAVFFPALKGFAPYYALLALGVLGLGFLLRPKARAGPAADPSGAEGEVPSE